MIGGGGSYNYMEGDDGDDLGVGDCAMIVFDDYFIKSITSISPNDGQRDVINMGKGNDVAIGGQGMDDIEGGKGGTNILAGDSAEILFYSSRLPTTGPDNDNFWNAPMNIGTIGCDSGDADLIKGSDGTDYIIGGALDDTIQALGGPDLVLGDHGTIVMSKDSPYKLLNVTTTDPSCAPGSDNITLGDGNDIAFGGALGDYIEGNEGQDIILGDFGVIKLNPFAPNLGGVLSIDSLDCLQDTEGNKLFGHDGDGELFVSSRNLSHFNQGLVLTSVCSHIIPATARYTHWWSR